MGEELIKFIFLMTALFLMSFSWGMYRSEAEISDKCKESGVVVINDVLFECKEAMPHTENMMDE